MPVELDPQAASLVAYLKQLGMPSFSTQDPAETRRMLLEARRPVKKEEVAEVREITVAGSIPARLYRPAGSAATDTLPGVVFFHGGGWVIGDLEGHDATCRILANRSGAAFVSVDYRLAPEHPFPAAVDDAWAATEWVATHGSELGVDTGRLAVAGDSAGGNLAAVVAILARDAGGPALAFQLLVYPVTDLSMSFPSIRENADAPILTRDDMAWFIDHYGATPSDWRASPLAAPDLSGVAPALVITASHDPLRDEGEAYAARLRDAGVRTTLTRYPGMFHGFFGMTPLDAARAANDEAGAALRRALAG